MRNAPWFDLARHNEEPANGGQSDTDTTVTTGETEEKAGADPAAELEKWKALARKHEGRAKENAAAAEELAKLRAAQQTDTERAVAEAEQRGRAEAMKTTGEKLARAEFRAAAAGVLADADTLVDDLNLAKFLDSEGNPDTEAIKAAVQRLAAAAPKPAVADMHQGARGGGEANFANASRAELAAALAPYGLKTRS